MLCFLLTLVEHIRWIPLFIVLKIMDVLQWQHSIERDKVLKCYLANLPETEVRVNAVVNVWIRRIRPVKCTRSDVGHIL